MSARVRPLRTLPIRAAGGVGHKTALLGERRGTDFLIYNPVTMWNYHRLALQDGVAVASAFVDVFPNCTRYADVGAGSGAFAAALRGRGVEAVAYERSRLGRMLGRFQGAVMRGFDLTRKPTPPNADLAYSFEVAEHLAPALGRELVVYLVRCAPVIVFTAAQPGQGGYGHVNEQPRSYWEALFADQTCFQWAEACGALKRAFAREGVKGQWFYDNLSVFCRSGVDREYTSAV